MVSNQEFRTLALDFQGAEESPHFDKIAFKVTGRRIFATLDEKIRVGNLKLPLKEQSVFSDYGVGVYPVPNKWGLQGWTTFELDQLPVGLIADALNVAYDEVFKVKK